MSTSATTAAWCCRICRCASTTTTASLCSAPTATANQLWSSCSPASSNRCSGTVTRAATLKVGYFAQHQVDELDLQRHALRARAQADAGPAGSESARAVSAPSASRKPPPTPRSRNSSGGEKARLVAGSGDFRRAATDHSRRADQPSRHRQPRRADRGDQRLSRRGYPGVARPLSAGSLRRPALAGSGGHGRSRSTATSTTTMRLVLSDGKAGHTTAGAKSTTAASNPVSEARARRRRKSAPRPPRCVSRFRRPKREIAQLNKQLGKLDATLSERHFVRQGPGSAAEVIEDARQRRRRRSPRRKKPGSPPRARSRRRNA